MEEWKKYKLIEVCSRLRSGKGIKSDLVSNKGTYPVIGGNGVRGYTESSNFKGSCGIIGRQGAYCGNVKYFEGEAYMTEHAVVVVGNEIADTYYLTSLLSLMHLGNLSAQSAQPGLSVQTLAKQCICLPSIKYQKYASKFLKSIDDKIELNHRINDNLEQQAQALFKSWFVDFEPFKNGKFVDSELGMIPEGWKTGTIGDYSRVRSGFAFKSSWWTNHGCKVIKIKNITNDYKLDMTDCSFVERVNVTRAGEFKAKTGDLLIAMTGATIGKFCIVSSSDDDLYVNQRVGKFFLGEEPLLALPFIYGCLKQDAIINEIINKGQGSAQPNISSSDIESIKIILPPNNDIINRYNNLLKPYYISIIRITLEYEMLCQTRDTLLPKLMSGELKVNDLHS